MTFDELFAFEPAPDDAAAPSGQSAWIAPGAPATDEPRLFGGVLIGQAIAAASLGTRRCHALHGLFISVGFKEQPFQIAVDRTRDGGSFSSRRVEIRQHDRLLFAGYSSHHDGDQGPEHQAAMPDLPEPDQLEERRMTRTGGPGAATGAGPRYLPYVMLDARPVPTSAIRPRQDGEPIQAVWFRPRDPIRGGPEIHQAAIGFASDMGLVHVGLQPHTGKGRELQAASLDHAIWFHRQASANDWLLHVQSSPTAGHGRGFSQATVFTQGGVLVASVAQEFLARRKRGAGEQQ